MADYSIWMLGKSQITVSGGKDLSGYSRGDGRQLFGEKVRLNSRAWEEVRISDKNDSDFDDNDGDQKLDGPQRIDGRTYGNKTRVEAEYRITLRDPETGEEYEAVGFNLHEPGRGNSFGSTEGLAFVDRFPPSGVDLDVVSTSEGPRGKTGIDASCYAAPACFVAGSLIAVPGGKTPVECLKPGDPVMTPCGRAVPVRIRLLQSISPAEARDQEAFRPIRIGAGSLGPGLPSRDLHVSRQHRMLIRSPIAERILGHREVLVPALRLAGLPGISEEAVDRVITYVHLVLDRHGIVLAEDAPCESFLAGKGSLATLSQRDRALVADIYPDAVFRGIRPEPARLIPSRQDQRHLVRAHLQAGQPLVSGPPVADPDLPYGSPPGGCLLEGAEALFP